MSKRTKRTGREPALSSQGSGFLTGLEPVLSRGHSADYGLFRIAGLEAPQIPGRRAPLVVFANSNDDAAELVQLVVESNGYEIRRTNSGIDALNLVRALEPNLLVAEARLIGMSGVELVRRIRADRDPLICNLPILAMDVRSYRQAVRDAFYGGADDYLILPCELPVLLRTWRRIIDGLRRPAPLTALLNHDVAVRQHALYYLLEQRPEGLEAGLMDLSNYPISEVSESAHWALRQLAIDN